MLNVILRSWGIGAWVAALALTVAISVAADANLSTIVFLLVLGVSPLIVMAVLSASAPSPTVAEILYRVRAKEGR